MANFEQEDNALAALQDPATSPEDLLAITTAQPNLWVLVAQHPNVYPDLLAYLSQYGDETVRAVVAAREAQAAGAGYIAPVQPTMPTLIMPASMDEPIGPELTPVPLALPPETFSQPEALMPAPPRQKPNSRRVIIIVAASVVFLLCVALAVYFLVIRPQQINTAQVKEDFAAAVDQYQQAQTTLTQKIADAGDIQGVNAQVADPKVNDNLSSAISAARGLVAPPPDMSDDPKQIKSQTDDLTRQTQACDDAVLTLGQAMDSVTASRIQYATDTLNQAIADAQAVLDQSQGLVSDESTRTSLASVIQQAHSIVDGFRTGDPSTFADNITAQQTALQQASQAVLDVQATKCDNGVIVPAGINPMVCQAMPANAMQLVTVGPYLSYNQFSMPSGNVGCTKEPYGSGMICEIFRKDWTLPAEIAPPCAPNAEICGSPEAAIRGGVVTSIRHTDVAPWSNNVSDPSLTVPVLAYGQVANFYPVACLSDEDGVICWDTSTHHGFQMSVTEFTYW